MTQIECAAMVTLAVEVRCTCGERLTAVCRVLDTEPGTPVQVHVQQCDRCNEASYSSGYGDGHKEGRADMLAEMSEGIEVAA